MSTLADAIALLTILFDVQRLVICCLGLERQPVVLVLLGLVDHWGGILQAAEAAPSVTQCDGQVITAVL